MVLLQEHDHRLNFHLTGKYQKWSQGQVLHPSCEVGSCKGAGGLPGDRVGGPAGHRAPEVWNKVLPAFDAARSPGEPVTIEMHQ
jgi:hypothetical protein